MNKFLQSRDEIVDCTMWLRENGFIEHPISCKNFDLRNIIPALSNGNILDMGSAGGSTILQNAVRKNIYGVKMGIDLEYAPDIVSPDKGIDLISGDLMASPFPDKFFNFICCLSVIEHGCDFTLLAEECSRLLTVGGKLFITFDYWPTKINTDGLTLYGLPWNILDNEAVMGLVFTCGNKGLQLTSNIDWKTREAVINPKYCSPFPGISYTFGILEFIKE